MAPKQKTAKMATEGPTAKEANKIVAVGDPIFDFELETEEAGVTAKIQVSDCPQEGTLCFAPLAAC
jgi:hypothetical protein